MGMEREVAASMRVIAIVGASSGIGAELARACAAAGDAVVLVGRRQNALEDVAQSILSSCADASERVLPVVADVRDRNAGDEIVTKTLAHFERLDVVVYAAGWNVKRRELINLDWESWDAILETNLAGAFGVTRAAVPVMSRQGNGLILYISSSGAKRPDRSGVAYQAAKAGLAALAFATMEEHREDNIRTTVIYPGVTNTPFLEHRPVPTDQETRQRILQPQDVAAACKLVIDLPDRCHVPELLIYPTRP